MGLAHGSLVYDGSAEGLSEADLQRIYPGQQATCTAPLPAMSYCAELRG